MPHYVEMPNMHQISLLVIQLIIFLLIGMYTDLFWPVIKKLFTRRKKSKS